MQQARLFLFINLITFACMNTSTTYQYADGSANVYIIKPDSLEYIPIRPEESSTGFYSGGDPKKVSVTPEEYRTMSTMLEAARKKHEIHIPDRIKTSGMITIFSGDEKTQFILTPGCKEITEIETALKKLLK
jgi:hypothetical protein